MTEENHSDKNKEKKKILVVSKDDGQNLAPLAGPGMVEEKPATVIKTSDKNEDVVVSNEAKNLAPLAGPEKELDKVEKKVEEKNENEVDLFKKNDISKDKKEDPMKPHHKDEVKNDKEDSMNHKDEVKNDKEDSMNHKDEVKKDKEGSINHKDEVKKDKEGSINHKDEMKPHHEPTEKKREGRFVIGSKYSEDKKGDCKEECPGKKGDCKEECPDKKGDCKEECPDKKGECKEESKKSEPKKPSPTPNTKPDQKQVNIDENKNKQHSVNFIPVKMERIPNESLLIKFRNENNILTEGSFYKKRTFFFCFWVEKYFILLKTGQLIWIEKDGKGEGSGNWNLKHATAFNKLDYEGYPHPYRLTFSLEGSSCYFAYDEKKERDYWYETFQDISRTMK